MKMSLRITQFTSSAIAPILAILVLVVGLSTLFWGYQGSLLMDCGREAYVPSEVLRGRVLIKEVFIVYGPLSYQVNALLFLIFGTSLNTLYLAGATTTAVSLMLLYSILRRFLPSHLCLGAVLLVATSCAFRVDIFNWIFPYSYAAVYALACILGSLLLTLTLRDLKTSLVLYGAPLLAGAALTLKYDYGLYGASLLTYFWFGLRLSERQRVLVLASIITVPTLSFGVLLWQGLTITELSHYFVLIVKHARSPSTHYLYATFLGHSLDSTMLFRVLMTLFDTTALLALALLAIFALTHAVGTRTGVQRVIFASLLAVSSFVAFYTLNLTLTDESFSFLGLTTLSILLVCFSRRGRVALAALASDARTTPSSLLFLGFLCVVVCCKTLPFLDLSAYGTMTFPFFLGVNLIAVARLPRIWPKLANQTYWTAACTVLLCIIACVFCHKSYLAAERDKITSFSAERGTIHGSAAEVSLIRSAVEYIVRTVPVNASVVVWPEGEMVNFLSARPSDGYYHRMIPPYVETFEVSEVITQLTKKPPSLILLRARHATEYGRDSFCGDYAKEICRYVEASFAPALDLNTVSEVRGFRLQRKEHE